MDCKEIEKIPMFFIIGRPRSGTTLLRTLFDAHPEVNIPVECAYIIDLQKRYENIKIWNKELLLNFYEDLLVEFRFSNWHADTKKLKNELLKCEGENTFSNICKVVHSNYPSLFPKKKLKFIGDKNPIYSVYTKKLLRIFPEAKFIFIYKDYRDNYVSIAKAQFGLPIVPMQVYHWKYFYHLVKNHSKKYPDRFLFLKYEDFVTEPEFYTKKVFHFIGLQYDSSVMDFYKKKDEIIDKYGIVAEGKHQSLLNPINTSRIGQWKNKLTQKQVQLADMTAGSLAEELGYERVYKKFNILTWMQAIPYILYAKHINILGFITDLLPYKTRIKVKQKPSIIVNIYMKLFAKKNQG